MYIFKILLAKKNQNFKAKLQKVILVLKEALENLKTINKKIWIQMLCIFCKNSLITFRMTHVYRDRWRKMVVERPPFGGDQNLQNVDYF